MPDYIPKAAKQFHRHYNTLITGDVHPSNHPVAKGNAREHGWQKMFRRFLPERFGVKSGFIVDSTGKISQQIDCIIYRKDVGIELYSVGQEIVIPVEVVFAAFEIKPRIDKETLSYAEKKATSIGKLIMSNYWLQSDEDFPKPYLGNFSADGGVIFGLLADKVSWSEKWQFELFKKLLQNSDTKIALFMTVKDGCVNTLKTGYPTEIYEFFGGDHALLNQLIRLVESLTELEKARCLDSCCLTNYTQRLKKSESIHI